MDGGRHAEAIAMIRKTLEIDAGEIGYKAWFKRPSDHSFWSDMTTRPCMRAAHNLILELWEDDPADRDEAVRLGDHPPRIDPNDHQGIRIFLL